MAGGNFITRRDGIWHFVRRVPAAIAHLDKRTFVKQSTKVRVADDPRGLTASRVADRLNDEFEAYWRGLGEGQAAEAKARFDEARRRARMFGFAYVEAQDLPARPRGEVRARLERLNATETEEAAAALLGGESPPKIHISRLFDEYEALTEGARKDLSPDQVRKWRNPRRRCVANLLEVLGDKPLVDISHDDAIEFHDWWRDRVLYEDVEIGTANRDISGISKMLKTVDRRHRLGLGDIFAGLRLEGAITRSRLPFSIDFLRARLLAPGALNVLNDEARDAIYLIAETGLRLSEAVNLLPERILLDADIPHVQIRPDGRRLKTPQSERDIPLVGVALDAMRRRRDGFPRYRDKAASFSAAVNKTLAAHGLLEQGRTIYSLRHSFEDRLGDVEAPEKMIAAMMGHKHARPKYGAGASLAQKQRWLKQIALDRKDTPSDVRHTVAG